MRARTSPSTASIFSASAAFSGSMGARTASPTGGSGTRAADACPRAPTRARATAGAAVRWTRRAGGGERRRALAGPPPARASEPAPRRRRRRGEEARGRARRARRPLARPRALAGTREDVSTDRGSAPSGGARPRASRRRTRRRTARPPRGTAGLERHADRSRGLVFHRVRVGVQYTRMAPFSSKPNRVYPPTMRSDLARLSYTSSNSSASTASRGSSFSTCASLNTSARHSRIGTELASAWRASTVGVRHTSSLPERPRSNTAPVIFRPTTQTPPDDRRSPRDRRTRPDRDPAGTGRAPQLALAGRAPSVPQRPTAPNLARHFGPARAVPTVNVREAVGV